MSRKWSQSIMSSFCCHKINSPTTVSRGSWALYVDASAAPALESLACLTNKERPCLKTDKNPEKNKNS